MLVKNFKIFNKKRLVSLIIAGIVFVTVGSMSKEKEDVSNLSFNDLSNEQESDDIVMLNGIGNITGNYVNFRDNPSIEGIVIGSFMQDDNVIVVGLVDDEWYYVKYNDKIGYVNKEYVNYISYEEINNKYVEVLEREEKINGLNSKVIGKVHTIGDCVNIRSIPSLDGEVLKKCKRGEEYSYIGYESGWYTIINSNGDIGYISGEYVSINGNYRDDYLYSAVVTADKIFVMCDAGDECAAIDILSKYEIVEVIKDSGEWLQVRYYSNINNKSCYGWINRNDIYKLSEKYIDIDISAQTLKICEGSEILFECDVVTGNNDVTPTPIGKRTVLGKLENYVMKGTNTDGTKYEAPTDYAIKLGDGIYIHNLSNTKVNVSNKNAYLEGRGSHGCIRATDADIVKIYKLVNKNDLVVIHR